MQLTVNQRIKKIQETVGKQRLFSKMIGIKETTISSLFQDKATLPSYMVLEAILKAFPEINARWLLLGEGEMNDKYENLDKSENVEPLEMNEPPVTYGLQNTEGVLERIERLLNEQKQDIIEIKQILKNTEKRLHGTLEQKYQT